MSPTARDASPPSERLEDLLATARQVAAESPGDAFAHEVGDRPLVLYGAGETGRTSLEALRAAGHPPIAVVDRGATGDGHLGAVPLLNPQGAAEEHGFGAAFVVTVVNPGTPFREVADFLHSLGCQVVVPFPVMARAYPDRLLPRYAVDRVSASPDTEDAIRAAYALLDDEASRAEFLNQLAWRVDGRLDRVNPAHGTPDDQYFPQDLFELRDDEFFVDIGAFDGDTVVSLVRHSGSGFGHVLALEPDPMNLAAFRATVATLPADVQDRIQIGPFAASNAAGTQRLTGIGTASAVLGDAGGVEVRTARLDELLDGRSPTYIKMDIEGAEPLALEGASSVIGRSRPVLAVCVYHARDHLWTLPLQVASLVGDGYTFHLRRYAADFFDEILYAVPAERRGMAS